MKLKKEKLIAATLEGMHKLDYQYVKDSESGANGLFIKLVKEDYFLTVGYTISNLYDSRFTASFYLSKTTRWASVWGDIPLKSYERISHFLTREQRAMLLNDEFNRPNVTDGWWRGDEIDIQKFLQTVQISEQPFLQQDRLFAEIDNSLTLKKLAANASMVISLIDDFNYDGFDYKFSPKGNVDDIPIEWFQVAEKVLEKTGETLNAYTVKALAADAWRQKLIKHGHPKG